jgi:hypothetical protein
MIARFCSRNGLDGKYPHGKFPGHSQRSKIKFYRKRQNSYAMRVFPNLITFTLSIYIS